jgi:hypothetical protein
MKTDPKLIAVDTRTDVAVVEREVPFSNNGGRRLDIGKTLYLTAYLTKELVVVDMGDELMLFKFDNDAHKKQSWKFVRIMAHKWNKERQWQPLTATDEMFLKDYKLKKWPELREEAVKFAA